MAAGIQLNISDGVTTHNDHDGSITEDITASDVWKTKSVLLRVDDGATTLTLSFKCIGGTTSGVLLSVPMVAVVGNNRNDVMRAT
ncbi:hypothetical protein [Ollibium composti]|uniref:Uncharacterized protein n=1 Tax=Ollibium composti TaxID=2675109 RepID=A0ABY2Q4A2_9HYPH|nr:hypothetical protein [Mesorhizobium composti]THF54759.1 hypothetical protein E6C48_21025 [Mesorhizobium composti]